MQDTDAALGALAQARTSTESISDPFAKARVLRDIAAAYGQLQNTNAALEALAQLRTTTESISDSSDKALLLSDIAEAQANLQAWRQVHITADACDTRDCEASVLSTGLTAWAEHRHPELKEEDL